jgi:hypothetical protein
VREARPVNEARPVRKARPVSKTRPVSSRRRQTICQCRHGHCGGRSQDARRMTRAYRANSLGMIRLWEHICPVGGSGKNLLLRRDLVSYTSTY